MIIKLNSKDVTMKTLVFLHLWKAVIIIPFTIVCLLIPLSVHAQPAEESVDTAHIDQFVNSAMNELNIPGASLAIVKEGRIVYMEGYGISGPDSSPVTPQTPFVLGSTSKSITAMAVIQLVEKGKIRLDDPVQYYLPWFRVADLEASRRITIRELLNQTSGLSTYAGESTLTTGDESIEQHIRSLKHVQLTAPVGSVFQYSNLNYNILSGVIQAASGQSYTEYVQQHIFKPLHMKHSYTSPDEARKDGLATGYQPVFGFMLPTKQLNHEGTVASGYLISSAEDMAHYLTAQMNEGQNGPSPVLSVKGIRTLQKPIAYMGGGSYYAMGWVVDKEGISHNGATENTYSKMTINENYGVILLVNSLDYLDLQSYDKIMTGINAILNGGEIPQIGMSDLERTIFLLVNWVLITILAILAQSVFGLFNWKTRSRTTSGRLLHIVSILFFHVLIPSLLLMTLPKLLVPWSVIKLFLPGLGHVIYFILILLLGVGVVKTALVMRTILKKKHHLV